MNELMRIFEPATSTQRFDQIQISIASPERIRSWSFGKLKSRRPSTTELLSRSATAFSVPASLVRSKTMSAFVEI